MAIQFFWGFYHIHDSICDTLYASFNKFCSWRSKIFFYFVTINYFAMIAMWTFFLMLCEIVLIYWQSFCKGQWNIYSKYITGFSMLFIYINTYVCIIYTYIFIIYIYIYTIYIYIYMHIYIYIYIYAYIYASLPRHAIVRISHPRSRDSQGQETFSAPSANKQTCNYDMCWNHHISQSPICKFSKTCHSQTTLSSEWR